ncbi:prepilin-type N-terminal cleavage/methylation domain-containing protein [Legionella sp. km772]|uniref:prepilin-type N-terminal cleavage/methylation domain-containing protein n=1 Tax=Legionella sp. km772 TaxID=2498111 RepID=UPI000F8C7630|nr:prepilin-type N-terminal cleavage/methylation domain-containing protein [Legionella sp. km772]RUR12179.1 prepilin-type N-terminal cleavage/methylation domain-containing protein [Legionella sp. km772]
MNKNGFTLLELLFTLSVLAILILFSFSSLLQMKQKNEREFLINEIGNAISYAKINARARGHTLTLLPKAPHINWSQGMELFADETCEKLLYTWSWRLAYWHVEWLGVNGLKRIKLSGNTQAMSNGRFVLTNIRTEEKITLYLNRLGRVKQV